MLRNCTLDRNALSDDFMSYKHLLTPSLNHILESRPILKPSLALENLYTSILYPHDVWGACMSHHTLEHLWRLLICHQQHSIPSVGFEPRPRIRLQHCILDPDTSSVDFMSYKHLLTWLGWWWQAVCVVDCTFLKFVMFDFSVVCYQVTVPVIGRL